MNNKCVYLHLNLDGEIKYVGSGTKDRPYSRASRNAQWNSVFSQQKPEVVIVGENMSVEDSVSLEYYMYHSCIDTVVNTAEPRPARVMNFEYFNEYFYIDSTSLSGLRLKKKLPRNNTTNVGDVAGAVVSSGTGKDYWKVSHGDKSYLVHRIVYLLTNKYIDSNLVINHIDGNGLNNNISNLEETTHQVNSFNKPKIKSTSLPSGISYSKYKNKIDGFHSKYTPRGQTKQIVQRFGIAAFGSEAKALNAAKIWLEYYLHIHNWVISDKNIELLKLELIENMKIVHALRSNSNAYITPNGKWTSRLIIKKGKYISCGVFNTPEEAVAAKQKLIEEYNNSIVIEL